MTKTAQAVLTRAFRRAGVADAEEDLQGHQYATGLDIMQGIIDELRTLHGASITWTADTVPDGVFLPLAYAVAVEIGPEYGQPPRETRAQALLRLRAALFPDDRQTRADYDDDGTVDEGEAEADARGVYF